MKLLEKYQLGKLELKNRVVMPPMDTYSAVDGYVNDFHIAHYGARAIGNVGLIIQEATSVRADGRISEQDLGIWDDKFIPGLKRIVDMVHNLNSKIGIQLCDAGRKGAVKGGVHFAPSNISFSDYYEKPIKMTKKDIENIKNDFREAVIRSKKAGYDLIEIHAAHGYLLSQFISSYSNKRDDEYGGSLENRLRLLKEILEITRENFEGIISIRISSDEWTECGIKPNDIANELNKFKHLFDIVHVSSGGTVNKGILPFRPGYQIEHAKIVKDILNIPVIAVGLIDNFDLAEFAIQNMNIDLIAIGRALLRNPNWIFDEANRSNITIKDRIIMKRAFVNERFVIKNLER